jgi:hypothetical protein
VQVRVRVVDWEGTTAIQAAVVDVTVTARKRAEEEVRRSCEALEQQVRERTAALAHPRLGRACIQSVDLWEKSN